MNSEVKQPYHPSQCPQCSLQTEAAFPFCKRCKFDLRYGVLKRRVKGKCIYCENTNLTEEHIFPDWLSEVYPRRSTKTTHILRRPVRHAFYESKDMHANSEIHNHDPYTTKVRNVCEGCNNGWMSFLQNQAKELVRSFADGEYRLLTIDEKIILARWTVMVSINLQCYARMLTATIYQRQSLRNGLVPVGWEVNVGLLEAPDYAGLNYHSSISVPIQIGNGDYLPIQNTFFCIEEAVFHTISSIGYHLLDLAKYGTPGMQHLKLLSCVWPLKYNMSFISPNPLNIYGLDCLASFTGGLSYSFKD